MELINEKHPQTRIALAFVGWVVPDAEEYHSVAFSRAGNMFQMNLLTSIEAAGIPVSTVITSMPSPSWPSGHPMLVKSANYRLENGISVGSVSFVNLPLLKQLTIGLAVLMRLLTWGRS